MINKLGTSLDVLLCTFWLHASEMKPQLHYWREVVDDFGGAAPWTSPYTWDVKVFRIILTAGTNPSFKDKRREKILFHAKHMFKEEIIRIWYSIAPRSTHLIISRCVA